MRLELFIFDINIESHAVSHSAAVPENQQICKIWFSTMFTVYLNLSSTLVVRCSQKSSVKPSVSYLLSIKWKKKLADDVLFFIILFTAEYEKDLEGDVCGDTSGMFQRVLVSLITVSKHGPTATLAQCDTATLDYFNDRLLQII